ncbi:acylphosphatase [Agrococcus sp. HG114]|uniref:acylphosphatase n=1 Tax=Agrococcus sp. HG114 TaxID=2969757 RepID=UPI00215AD9D6|nr:acylphosphatase [Agrococcus sp. HG114]MCR8670806.1 acylphosphatase [Agrococcus sp. HG114]
MRRRFVVHGRVQGVGFRMAARREAERLGLAGSVRNRADGTVEAEAEGGADAVLAFGAWLEHGPPAARVDRVDAVEVEPSRAGRPDGFAVR